MQIVFCDDKKMFVIFLTITGIRTDLPTKLTITLLSTYKFVAF